MVSPPVTRGADKVKEKKKAEVEEDVEKEEAIGFQRMDEDSDIAAERQELYGEYDRLYESENEEGADQDNAMSSPFAHRVESAERAEPRSDGPMTSSPIAHSQSQHRRKALVLTREKSERIASRERSRDAEREAAPETAPAQAKAGRVRHRQPTTPTTPNTLQAKKPPTKRAKTLSVGSGTKEAGAPRLLL
ncbi:hypothetical protein B0H13DRAFT_2373911 [Mycena leptocephala]|nr:hypothetical protein B0H13DRAFT_2373911 [Mycena leptocephala]